MIGTRNMMIALLTAGVVCFSGTVLAGGACCAVEKKAPACQTQANSKDKKAAKTAKKEVCVNQTMSASEAKVGDVVCCPVMGTKFKVTDKSLFAEVNGKRIYVCCPGCVQPLKTDPEKYLKK